MIAVVQRVTEATVTVQDAQYVEEIGHGLCIFLGVERGDTEAEAAWLAGKIARLRVFRDGQGKMNCSVRDVDGSAMVISQFTLAGDCRKGNRPSFVRAAEPGDGEKLYLRFAEALARDHGVPVTRGIFGAMMQIDLVNDGPVTLIVERRPS